MVLWDANSSSLPLQQNHSLKINKDVSASQDGRLGGGLNGNFLEASRGRGYHSGLVAGPEGRFRVLQSFCSVLEPDCLTEGLCSQHRIIGQRPGMPDHGNKMGGGSVWALSPLFQFPQNRAGVVPATRDFKATDNTVMLQMPISSSF